jgi:hypothetical protein
LVAPAGHLLVSTRNAPAGAALPELATELEPGLTAGLDEEPPLPPLLEHAEARTATAAVAANARTAVDLFMRAIPFVV